MCTLGLLDDNSFWGTVGPSYGFKICFGARCFALLIFPSSSVSVSYFIIAVPMRRSSGEHSGVSSTFLIAMHVELNFLFR